MLKPKKTSAGEAAANQQKPQQAPPSSCTLISSDKNLMPSMVVRQQKSQAAVELTSINNNNNNNYHSDEVLTTRELLLKTRSASAAGAANNNNNKQPSQEFDQNGLVLPRRVAYQNPQLALDGGGGPAGTNTTLSLATIRDLHRELKFNQAHGRNVLEQKSELKRAMEKLEASRRRKEAEQERLSRRTSLELRLEERAQRIARDSSNANSSNSTKQPSGASQTDSTARVLG